MYSYLDIFSQHTDKFRLVLMIAKTGWLLEQRYFHAKHTLESNFQ